jgi:serpin B
VPGGSWAGRTVTSIVAVLVLGAGCAGTGSAGLVPAADPAIDRPSPDSADLDELVVGLNEVGFELFRAAAEDMHGDLVLSPLSIGLAFGMADAGASGRTATVLEELFAYPVAGGARWSAFNTLERSVTDVGDPVVRLANRQFPDDGFGLAPDYDERLGRWFGAGIEPLPLRADPEASRERINRWVAERTEQLIPELLGAGSLDRESRLVLVNALYLEAHWSQPFVEAFTAEAPFTRLDGTTVPAPFMRLSELPSPAVATDTFAAMELAYQGHELSMLLVVPAEGRYAEVEAALDGTWLEELDRAVSEVSVEVHLPRFDSDSTLDLRALLEGKLGVTGLFGVAGFEGIAPGITLGGAVHAADLTVDELGTVAAAATVLDLDGGAPQPTELTIRADRPFLYLVRHVPTGAVLFVGRVLDPTA